MKSVFADIRSLPTEPTAALPRGQIQTPKKPIAFGASARHSRRKKLLTPTSQYQEMSCQECLTGNAASVDFSRYERRACCDRVVLLSAKPPRLNQQASANPGAHLDASPPCQNSQSSPFRHHHLPAPRRHAPAVRMFPISIL